VISYTGKTFALAGILRALAVCVLLAGAYAGSALADSQYTYTGNPFTDSVGDTCPTTCFISGSFTLSTAIGPDNTVYSITPESWSFTDGTFTINPSNSSLFVGNEFSTNGSGDIDQWNFHVIGFFGFTTFTSISQGPSMGDYTFAADPFSYAYNSNPGTWAVSTVPEPSELLLVCLGLIGLISMRQVKLGRAGSN
jgi:hypothetical protein